jgi:hypothetical protein
MEFEVEAKLLEMNASAGITPYGGIYAWGSMEIFLGTLYNIFNKKTCKSKFRISTPNKAPFRRSCHIYTFTPLWLDITQ